MRLNQFLKKMANTEWVEYKWSEEEQKYITDKEEETNEVEQKEENTQCSDEDEEWINYKWDEEKEMWIAC